MHSNRQSNRGGNLQGDLGRWPGLCVCVCVCVCVFVGKLPLLHIIASACQCLSLPSACYSELPCPVHASAFPCSVHASEFPCPVHASAFHCPVTFPAQCTAMLFLVHCISLFLCPMHAMHFLVRCISVSSAR